MAKKTEVIKENDVKENAAAPIELEELWKMQFHDPASGAVVMIRKAFKPRGKLEFYQPENLK